ncbi:MAG: hypothetical protein ABW110_05575 [Steroidobacteraceae bacterium]
MIRKSEALFALLAILLAILFMAAGATKIVLKRSIFHDAPAGTLQPKYGWETGHGGSPHFG